MYPIIELHFFRHSIHPSNNNNSSANQNLLPAESTVTITNNPLTTAVSGAEISSHSSSMQSIPLANNEESTERRNTTTSQLVTNMLPNKSAHSFLSKLTDAKKTLFGRANIPDPFFSSADENKALLSYILTESDPKLDIIQQFESNGAQLNAITDEGNTAIHLLAKAEIQSIECMNIVDYLTKKGCDPNRQNDYGWTAGKSSFIIECIIGRIVIQWTKREKSEPIEPYRSH